MNSSEYFDIVCIGAGPAGLATALWCADLGLSAVVIEREPEFGGQLNIIHGKITNYLGMVADNGPGLEAEFSRHLSKHPATVRLRSNVIGASAEPLALTLRDGDELRCAALVIATGLRRRQLDVKGEAEFAGKGILASGVANREAVAGQCVVVVGGGDAAAENALILAERAEQVTLVHRRSELSAREEFVSQIANNDKIALRLNATVEEIEGIGRVDAVLIKTVDGSTESVPADSILIRAGWEPNTELVTGLVDLDDAGYVITDANCLTSRDNIYAIGDVRRPITPTISGAVGDAATVVKMIANELQTRRSR